MRARSARIQLLAGAIALLCLGACGGASRSEAPAASGRVAWDAMTEDQKMAYMKSTVLPRMKAIFREYDPHRYPKLDCVPCHTADHATRGWKMPNPDLLVDESCIRGTALSLYGSEAAAAAMAQMSKFMRERVQPEMASLLGRPADDPGTGKGFGCFGCHTLERPVPVPVPPP